VRSPGRNTSPFSSLRLRIQPSCLRATGAPVMTTCTALRCSRRRPERSCLHLRQKRETCWRRSSPGRLLAGCHFQLSARRAIFAFIMQRPARTRPPAISSRRPASPLTMSMISLSMKWAFHPRRPTAASMDPNSTSTSCVFRLMAKHATKIPSKARTASATPAISSSTTASPAPALRPKASTLCTSQLRTNFSTCFRALIASFHPRAWTHVSYSKPPRPGSRMWPTARSMTTFSTCAASSLHPTDRFTSSPA